MNNITFNEFNLSQDILKALDKKGFKIASEIQTKIIPIILENKNDVIGVAQTGTGKTAAFGLPIIERIGERNKFPKAIILAPTRELAIQVSEELNTYKGSKKLNIVSIYGGQSIINQMKEIKKGVDIVVGTPGRVLDMIKRKSLILDNLDFFVLDEADEMLKMGFIEDIETILSKTNKNKRVLLFSATMPEAIKKLSKKYMKDQIIIEAKKEDKKLLINQIFFEVNYSQRFEALTRIIDMESLFYGVIFCKTKVDVENLTAQLKQNRYDADCIHGDITQTKREKILQRFRDLKISILVATDVAARGIDVENLSHVVNYSLPQESETYIHRIGRTGRAGKKGTAITFISSREYPRLAHIERLTKDKIKKEKLPEKRDIMLKQQIKITKDIDEIISTKDYSSYIALSDNLIEKNDSQKVISALLYILQNKTEQKKVKNEGDFSSNNRRREKKRHYSAKRR